MCIFNFLGFCGTFCHMQKHNIISCFLISFTLPTEIFLLTCFSIFWPFIYSTTCMNKQCLEIWSCVCGYCVLTVYFLCLTLALKYLPIFRKARLHGRTKENAFYWKFKRKFRTRSCVPRVLKFSLERVLFCVPEYQGNAKGTPKERYLERSKNAFREDFSVRLLLSSTVNLVQGFWRDL